MTIPTGFLQAHRSVPLHRGERRVASRAGTAAGDDAQRPNRRTIRGMNTLPWWRNDE